MLIDPNLAQRIFATSLMAIGIAPPMAPPECVGSTFGRKAAPPPPTV